MKRVTTDQKDAVHYAWEDWSLFGQKVGKWLLLDLKPSYVVIRMFSFSLSPHLQLIS